MLNKLKLISVILLSVLFLCGCNDDIFIKQLQLSPETAVLDPDNKTIRIHVSGENWCIASVELEDGVYHSLLPDKNSFQILTDVSSLNIESGDNHIDVTLVKYLASAENEATLKLTVGDDYQMQTVTLKIKPTDTYEIKIVNVLYTLNSWGGLPDRDFYHKFISQKFNPLESPQSFSFPQAKAITVTYWFSLNQNETSFAKRVMDSGIKIPVPSYVWNKIHSGNTWELTGEEAPLTSHVKNFITPYVPRMPAPVELPAGVPLTVELYGKYERVYLNCTIEAVNPVTEQTETLYYNLNLFQPTEFSTKVVTE